MVLGSTRIQSLETCITGVKLGMNHQLLMGRELGPHSQPPRQEHSLPNQSNFPASFPKVSIDGDILSEGCQLTR
ncbi:hypothetical protein LINPERHAP2_LOCUS37209, partial [Linum perenne]